jgi:hypothetical protein
MITKSLFSFSFVVANCERGFLSVSRHFTLSLRDDLHLAWSDGGGESDFACVCFSGNDSSGYAFTSALMRSGNPAQQPREKNWLGSNC